MDQIKTQLAATIFTDKQLSQTGLQPPEQQPTVRLFAI